MSAAHVVLFKPSDLRLHDHAPLCAAHEAAKVDEHSFVLHLLVLDESLGFGLRASPSREAHLPRMGRLRASFVVQSISSLHASLASRGYELLVFIGRTEEALAAVATLSQIAAVHTHGPELCSEERRIERQLGAQHRLRMYSGWTLTHPDDLPTAMQRGHAMPGRYKPFLDAVSRGKGPSRHRPPLAEPIWSAREAPAALRLAVVTATCRGGWGLPQNSDLLPAGADLLCDNEDASATQPQSGGEEAALAALRRYVWEEDRLRRYVGSSDSMTPGVDNALNATTHLSAYLAHGCLSARRLYDEVRSYEKRRVRNRSTYWVRPHPHSTPRRCPSTTVESERPTPHHELVSHTVRFDGLRCTLAWFCRCTTS